MLFCFRPIKVWRGDGHTTFIRSGELNINVSSTKNNLRWLTAVLVPHFL